MSKNWMKLEMRRYVHENNVWLSKGFYMHCSFGRRGRCLADVADGQVDARTSTNDQSLLIDQLCATYCSISILKIA